MSAWGRAVLAGSLGSLTTNALHEIVRRCVPQAPRVDLLGMQAITKAADAIAVDAPTGGRLYASTLAADVVANAAYFALTACMPRRFALATGTAIGLLAGIGAVALPGPLGLSTITTSRTDLTRALTALVYTAGGAVTGAILQETADDEADERYFTGKHVIVTGGTRGLGYRLTRLLLNAGARVTICGRSADTLDAAVAKLGAAAGALAGIVCDVRDRAQCEALVVQSIERQGPIDVLVNNAGVIEVGPLIEQTIDDYREALDTHFWAPLYLATAVLPGMRKRRAGSIVNIASVGGLVGVPHLAPYSASKFAQVGFTQALTAEVASEGVRVTSVTPGLMITGSPDRAIFKGRNRAEYAWFTLSDANPLISVSVDVAARRILRAIRHGDAQLTIGWTASLAKTLNALFPQSMATLLRVAAGLLPAPGGVGTERREGAQSHSAWTQNPLTWLNARAMRRTNEEPHTTEP